MGSADTSLMAPLRSFRSFFQHTCGKGALKKFNLAYFFLPDLNYKCGYLRLLLYLANRSKCVVSISWDKCDLVNFSILIWNFLSRKNPNCVRYEWRKKSLDSRYFPIHIFPLHPILQVMCDEHELYQDANGEKDRSLVIIRAVKIPELYRCHRDLVAWSPHLLHKTFFFPEAPVGRLQEQEHHWNEPN